MNAIQKCETCGDGVGFVRSFFPDQLLRCPEHCEHEPGYTSAQALAIVNNTPFPGAVMCFKCGTVLRGRASSPDTTEGAATDEWNEAILSAEDVTAIIEPGMCRGGLAPKPPSVFALAASHEALRAQVVALTEERDAARDHTREVSEDARTEIDELEARVAALEAGLRDLLAEYIGGDVVHPEPPVVTRARVLLGGTEPAAATEGENTDG